jgi:hypothetical protein
MGGGEAVERVVARHPRRAGKRLLQGVKQPHPILLVIEGQARGGPRSRSVVDDARVQGGGGLPGRVEASSIHLEGGAQEATDIILQ